VNALWVILPTIKCWPGTHKLGTIGAKRAQEVLLGLRPEPTMPAKVAAIAPVVHIPKWQALTTPIYAKDAHKVNGGYFTSCLNYSFWFQCFLVLMLSCFNVKVTLNVTDLF
jgi:hypothetical protein